MSTPQTTTSSSSSSSSSSSPLSTNTSSNDSTYHHHTTIYYIIIFLSILGGIVLLSLLGVIAIRYINQRRRNRHQDVNDSFWRKWHLNLARYSSVDGDSATEASSNSSSLKEFSPDMMQKDGQGYEYDGLAAAGNDERRRRSGSGAIMNWWQRGKGFSRIEEGLGEEYVCVGTTLKDSEKSKNKKQKQKLGTVHKVKRFKPNDTFEIDSDVRMSVDLTVVPSRCPTRQ
ncbi:hypothetical protein Agabi119p4_11601 [Agaricus bisporus var. burnettii]|uniref:Uncharacterized protein n=1 Tax=Agaricus bisporus var. burnettii TaxID=192524 RepID=A0A8H7C0N0_AGABI|nr:hypothetical protein Agabi119p4_11601 [Agaricus bisporus var. burnettii]